MIEAVSALLGLVRVPKDHKRGGEKASYQFSFPRLVSSFKSPSVVLCRTPWSSPEVPQNALESNLAARLGAHRVREGLNQIRAYSPDRIQWVSKPGADTFGMMIAAVRAIERSGSQMHAQLSNGGIRFSNDQVVVDVTKTHSGECEFTAFISGDKLPAAEAAIAASAADSISVDLSANYRSYSWSSSSGQGGFENFPSPLFDSRNPFGEMENFLGHFFGDSRNRDEFLGGNHQPGWGHPDQSPGPTHRPDSIHSSPRLSPSPNSSSAARELESMGAQVIVPSGPRGSGHVDWSSLAGYERVKAQVEESIILGLKHPSLFEKLIKKTRKGNKGSNRPKVVLFQGPPGTGKTSTCKIIANETNIPMIHIPLESIVSKWFGESEKHVARFYELGKEVAKSGGYDGVILFIDEIDSLVSSRDAGSPHEASKRILSVLLRHIDGFAENDIPTMLICATNRPQDLDSAFINRVDSSVEFGLPGADSRGKILRMYAKHLGDKEIDELAEITRGLSGRNLKDLCQSAERVWTSSVIRGLREGTSDDEVDIAPPPLAVYLAEAKKKVDQQRNDNNRRY